MVEFHFTPQQKALVRRALEGDPESVKVLQQATAIKQRQKATINAYMRKDWDGKVYYHFTWIGKEDERLTFEADVVHLLTDYGLIQCARIETVYRDHKWHATATIMQTEKERRLKTRRVRMAKKKGVADLVAHAQKMTQSEKQKVLAELKAQLLEI